MTHRGRLSAIFSLVAIAIAMFALMAKESGGCAQAAAGTCPAADSPTFARGFTANEDGADSDSRIEGDTDANALYVDASTSFVGVGTSSPASKFHVASGTSTLVGLSFSTLVAAANLNSQALTNINVDSGTIDGTTQATGTLNGSLAVGGSWTAAATWTLPAVTLGGVVSGGGQQLNNVIIGTVTPLAGTFTTLTTGGATSLTGGDTAIGNGFGLIVGNASQVTIGGTLAELEILGTVAADSRMLAGRWNSGGSAAVLGGMSSRNANIGSFTSVSSGDSLVNIEAYGDDGFDYNGRAALIEFRADAAWGNTDHPGAMLFYVTADAADDVTEALRINNGRVITTLAAAPTNVTAAGAGIFGGGMAFTDVANAWIDDASQGTGTVTHYIGNQTIDTTASDARLKNVLGSSTQDALQVIGGLPLVDFTWRADQASDMAARPSNGPWLGMTAQDLYDYLPQYVIKPAGVDRKEILEATAIDRETAAIVARAEEIVATKAAKARDGDTSTEADAIRANARAKKVIAEQATVQARDAQQAAAVARSTWSINYQYMVPLAFKGIQELQAEIVTLKSRIAALEAALALP